MTGQSRRSGSGTLVRVVQGSGEATVILEAPEEREQRRRQRQAS